MACDLKITVIVCAHNEARAQGLVIAREARESESGDELFLTPTRVMDRLKVAILARPASFMVVSHL